MRSEFRDVRRGDGVIQGTVSSSGGVVEGNGFSVLRVSTGSYRVSLSRPMRTVGAPVVGGSQSLTFSCVAVEETYFVVNVADFGGTQRDAAFFFYVPEVKT